MERLGLTVGNSGSLLALASKVVGGRDDSPFGSTPIDVDGAVVQVVSVSHRISNRSTLTRVTVVLASGEPGPGRERPLAGRRLPMVIGRVRGLEHLTGSGRSPAVTR